MSTTIAKTDLSAFIKQLMSKYPVYVPKKTGDDFVFDQIKSPAEFAQNAGLTILPPTHLLMPMRETLFTFYEQESRPVPATKPFVIFGVNPNDLVAIAQLDEMMSQPEPDRAYLKRRKSALIIGMGNQYLRSSAKLKDQPAYDLFLANDNDRYFVILGTEKGKKLINAPWFHRTSDSAPKPQAIKDPLLDDISKLKKLVAEGESSKVFDKLAERCLGCGICSYVCPLCYCFEQEDHTNLDTKSGHRCRHRDACMLPQFFAVANFNFKETLRKRYYNWYHHKFVRMPAEYGQIGCVNCGRCIQLCPVRINFREVLEELGKENSKIKVLKR